MTDTPNHNFNVPEKGTGNWHIPLNENFAQQDTDIEIRDAEENLTDYEPKDGAKFFATDTARIFHGDGSNWNVVPSSGKEPKINGMIYKQRGKPTSSVLSEGEVMVYNSDGTGDHEQGDLVYAINDMGTIRTKSIGTIDTHDEEFSRAEKHAKELRNAVLAFRVNWQNGGSSTGTAWFMDDHRIITNAHNVEGLVDNNNAELYLWTLDGTEVDATIERVADRSEEPDLALLTTNDTAPFVPNLGDSDELTEGDNVARVGNPYRIGYWTMGYGKVLDPDFFGGGKFSAALPTGGGGLSGSPVINTDGEVVGTTWGGTSRQETPSPDETPQPKDPELYERFNHKKYTASLQVGMNTILEWLNE